MKLLATDKNILSKLLGKALLGMHDVTCVVVRGTVCNCSGHRCHEKSKCEYYYERFERGGDKI